LSNRVTSFGRSGRCIPRPAPHLLHPGCREDASAMSDQWDRAILKLSRNINLRDAGILRDSTPAKPGPPLITSDQIKAFRIVIRDVAAFREHRDCRESNYRRKAKLEKPRIILGQQRIPQTTDHTQRAFGQRCRSALAGVASAWCLCWIQIDWFSTRFRRWTKMAGSFSGTPSSRSAWSKRSQAASSSLLLAGSASNFLMIS
jgi:hypothetical protein